MAELELATRRGWQVVRLTSETLAVEVVPGFGGTICSIRRRSDDLELLHQTPWGLPPYGSIQLSGTAEAERFDLDPGGWQTLFPNGGDTVTVNGAEQGFDGEARIAYFDILPTENDDAGSPTAATLRMRTRLRRSPFELTKSVTLDDAEVRVTETVRNVGIGECEVMWGSQVRIGRPLAGPDAEVESTASMVHPDANHLYDVDYDDVNPWPRTPGSSSMINLRFLPEPDSENRVAYLTDLTVGTISVRNPTLDCALTLDWDVEALPHCWYELEAGETDDHPWYGRGYFLTLTPSSSWPAHGVHDARRISSTAVTLDTDEERSASVTLRIGPDAPQS